MSLTDLIDFIEEIWQLRSELDVQQLEKRLFKVSDGY